VNRKKILVMDDEDLVRDTVKEMLECTGFDVELAHDGNEAIFKYRKALSDGLPFHAIILDLIVPGGLGGKETASEILKLDSCAKVIISSGNKDDDIVSNYSIYGFSAAINKPFNLYELHETLQKIVV
jgi:DNA-binding response OmpR family regulator